MFIKRQRVETFLLISLGAIIGANLRYGVTVWATDHVGVGFPWGTLIINFTGSALLAFFYAWTTKHSALDPRLRLLVAVGFFGAYTTFSTFANDSIALIQAGNWVGGLGNLVGTNLLCLGGVIVGLAVGSQV